MVQDVQFSRRYFLTKLMWVHLKKNPQMLSPKKLMFMTGNRKTLMDILSVV